MNVGLVHGEDRNDVRQRAKRLLGSAFLRRGAVPGLILAIVILAIVFQFSTDGIFLGTRNVINLMRQTSITAMIALGLLLVVSQGEFDLSVGSMLGVVAMLTTLVGQNDEIPLWGVVLVGAAAGAAIGLWNGTWVAVFGVPSFIVTLGGLLALRGVALLISGGQTISGVRPEIANLGAGFVQGGMLVALLVVSLGIALVPLILIGRDSPGRRGSRVVRQGLLVLAIIGLGVLSLSATNGLPIPVVVVLVTAAALSWVMRNTVWGRQAYAVGGNRTASRLSGIRIRRHIMIAFIFVGLFTTVAALLFAGRLQAVPPQAGVFLELEAITAVIIGGASLFGGSGTVGGVLLGSLFMQSILNGLSLLNVPTAWLGVASGLALLMAVLFDTISQRGGRLVAHL